MVAAAPPEPRRPDSYSVSSQRECPKVSASKWPPISQSRDQRGGKPAQRSLVWSHGRPAEALGPASPVNMSKRGLFARLYVPNKTLIIVKSRLPKENLIRRTGGPWGPRRPKQPRGNDQIRPGRPKNGNRPPAGYASGRFHRRQVWGISAAANFQHDPEKCVAIFPRDKRGTRLRGDHAQTRSWSDRAPAGKAFSSGGFAAGRWAGSDAG